MNGKEMNWLYERDVYYDPQKYGLTIIGSISAPDLFYEYDMTVAWKEDSTGRIFVEHDSGCSCSSPFQGFTSINELSEIIDPDEPFPLPHKYDASDLRDFREILRRELKNK